ncbi:MAG: exosortase V [Sphingomonas sp.]
MTIDAAIPPAGIVRPRQILYDLMAARWPLLLGFVVLAIPTLISVAQQSWATEAGAHGPIVLATGLWLLSYNKITMRHAGRLPTVYWLVPTVLACAVYVPARAFDFISLEAGGLYLLGLVVTLILVGEKELRRHIFPFFYLAFVIPAPGWLLDKITLPLRAFVTSASVHLLQPLGYPVAQQGVSLAIAQYQLLVEDACSGMNSLIGLIAISQFYIYLMHRASWRYALVLVALVIPIAIVVNIMRVITLVLLTYYQGDGVAQGFLHETAGMALFVVALMITYAVDIVLQRLLPARWVNQA